jgi:enoyl-CoA hydratase
MANIQLHERDGIARLVFDRPESRANVLSTGLWTELIGHLETLTAARVRGLILSSAKPGVFIAGADLQEIAGGDATSIGSLIALGTRALALLEALPFPTVAAIDGAALGGGLEVALACDFRVVGSHPKVQLGLPEIRLSLIPGWGGTQRLPRLVGVEEALDRMLSGESYDARDPAPDDLVDATVESDALLAEAERILGDDTAEVREAKRDPIPPELLPSPEYLAELPAQLELLEPAKKGAAIELLKVVLGGAGLPLTQAIPLETAAFLKVATAPESRQAIADFFAARRKPEGS